VGPKLLLDTSHLMEHVDAMGKSIAAHVDAQPVPRAERLAVEYVQRQCGQIIELGVALGCAAFAMGVALGVYLLLQSL
jgi:hypothetical protein